MDVKITATAGSRCFDVLSYNRDADISLKLRACVEDSTNQAFLRATYYSPNKNGLQSAHMLFDYQTTFKIYLDSWYRVAMTWNKNDKLLQIIAFDNADSVGLVSRFTFSGIGDENLFQPGGFISLGQWELPTRTSVAESIWINQVALWKSELTRDEIRNNMRRVVKVSEPNLANLWKFTEGQGLMVQDVVSNNNLHMLGYGRRTPIWTL
uniref:Pentraxin n=5 Tax=Ciona intestinalis TaxID=7719 RepID=H2XR25_CIOIN